ncbi:hypothetical protein CXF83_21510 [Shewanella sp. Choline-02u-19]|nr:hypothetical protein CXF83_21510 [Shewanella sp. Choline-02u-19]
MTLTGLAQNIAVANGTVVIADNGSMTFEPTDNYYGHCGDLLITSRLTQMVTSTPVRSTSPSPITTKASLLATTATPYLKMAVWH